MLIEPKKSQNLIESESSEDVLRGVLSGVPVWDLQISRSYEVIASTEMEWCIVACAFVFLLFIVYTENELRLGPQQSG